MGTTHFRSNLRYADPKQNARVGTVPRMAGLAPYMDFMSDYSVYFNDFARTSDLDSNDWTTTAIGTTPTATLSDDLPGGRLILTNTATDNDGVQIQHTATGGGGEMFGPIQGGRLYFETDIRLFDANGNASTVEQNELFVGLCITDTTVLAGATDFIGFNKADGSGLINFVMGKNASASGVLIDQTVTSTGVTLGAANAGTTGTYYTNATKLGFLYDPNSPAVYIYVNNNHVATQTTLTYLPDDEELCVTYAFLNGEGVIKIAHSDYVLVAQER